MANKLSNNTEPADRAAISHTLELAKRDTQKDKCWIREALEDEMTCQEHSESFSTIVYTRGELQKPTPGPDGRTDNYLRGKLDVAPLEKSCIFDCPIADREELINHHFANRVHVYDRFKGEEYMDRLLDKAAVLLDGIKKRVSEAPKGDDIESLDAAIEALTIVDFTEVVEETPLLSTRLLDNVPFSVDLFGGENGPNAQAWTRRLKSDDPLLECQHMRHLMIRKGDKPLSSIARRTFSSLIPLQQLGDIDHVAVERYCRDRYALFDLEWSLLSNLESLCLDIRGIPEDRHQPLEALFVKMGKHLRLRALVLIGVPHLIDFDSVGSKEYVAQQEDDEFLVFPGNEHNPDTELTNYIHFLKECLRPGGELRLVVPNSQT
ncbi:hypothetical protein FSOLCH5_001166 [Fusarium solani]|jgi:hypothetical protein|uniref:Uncharacterized protein n=1 Tax=Fusarium solani TaxID=169388 RepID=A0A9P9L4A3_FUSSL|nr:uncharacterized protein B0J15DRAFT_541892 [Fusarium solani]KAH7273958.1 hypothetical protein B0J15DRAFT_541892 [Fusarium solani]